MHVFKKIFTLLLFIAIISYVMDKIVYFAISKMEENVFTGQNVGKFNHFLEVKDSIDLVFIGSSRANHHYNPKMFSKHSFNMGLDGRNIAYFWTVIKMLPIDKKQDVIINIDPNNIFDSEYTGEDITALGYQYHKSEKIKEELERRNKINPLIKYYWCIGYNSKILGVIINYLRPKYNYKKYNGFDPIIVSETQKAIRDKLFTKNIRLDCEEEKQIKPNEIAISYLKLIADYSKLNNKNLFVITTPVRNDKCKSDNKKLKEIMNSLSLNYHDFTDYFNQNQDPNLWKDNTHLSNLGADEFSEFLSGEIGE